MGIKVEIPGVDVQGTLKPENLFDTLAALLSVKFNKEITVKTRPPAWMDRAAQEGRMNQSGRSEDLPCRAEKVGSGRSNAYGI